MLNAIGKQVRKGDRRDAFGGRSAANGMCGGANR